MEKRIVKKASIPLFIRFGEIPPDGHSKIYASGEIVGEEVGISVYQAVNANGKYYPILPEDANDNGIADYFELLLESDTPVYIVTGTKIRFEGQDREPLLSDVVVLKNITNQYRRNRHI